MLLKCIGSDFTVKMHKNDFTLEMHDKLVYY